MNRIFLNLIVISVVLIFISSCEEDFVPDDVKAKKEYVIEGKIELSDLDIPAYVILSRSTSYFSTIDSSKVSDMYIDDAIVSVNDGEKTVELEYVCAKDLPFNLILKLVGELRGKLFNPKLCIYLDVNNELIKEVGRNYKLTIEHDNNTLTSTTKLVDRISMDSIRFENPPGDNIDSLAMFWATVDDPGDIKNYYKYTVRINNKKTNSFNSVFDDRVINGLKVDLPYQNPVNPRSSDFDRDIGFLYHRGDTIQFKFCSFEEAQFNFWQSFNFSNSQGPFSSYIRAKDNIEGGIGIWGASNCQIINMIIPEK